MSATPSQAWPTPHAPVPPVPPMPTTPSSHRGGRIAAWIVLALLGLGFVAWLVPDPAERVATREPPPSSGPIQTQRELRTEYAGRYRGENGDILRLDRDGSYFAEGYLQMGDLEWVVKGDGHIFVTTYLYTDFAGVTDVEGWTFEVRNGGRVLVEVRDSGEPMRNGARYVRIGR